MTDKPMTLPELSACPFCGSHDVECHESVTDFCVACCNCGARTGLVYFGASDAANAFKKREAIAAWNTRTGQLVERDGVEGEYICKCGLRVEPHRCRDTKGEF